MTQQTSTEVRALAPRPSRRAAFWLALGLVLGLAAAWYGTHLGHLQWDNDEGILTMLGWAVANGHQLYTDVWIDHPPGMPYLLAAAYNLLGATMPTARRLTLGLALAGVAAVAVLARRLGGALAGIAAAVLLLLAPHFFWLARSVNQDLPAMALGAWALVAAWRYRDGGRRRWLVLAGLLLGLGISLKLSPALLVVPLGLLVVGRASTDVIRPMADGASAVRKGADVRPANEDRRAGGRSASTTDDGPSDRRRSFSVAGWSSAGAGPALLRIVLGDGILLAGPIALVAATWLLAAPPGAVLDGVFGAPAAARAAYPPRAVAYADWLVRENLLAENLGLTALAVLGLTWLWRRQQRSDALVLAGWLGATCLALVTQRPMWPKHHWSLVLWPLAVGAGLGVSAAVETVRAARASGWSRVPRGLGLLLAAVLIAVALWLPPTAGRLRQLAAPDPFEAVLDGIRFVAENTAPGAPIVSDNGLLAFYNQRPMPPAAINLSSKRQRIGAITGQQLIAAAESGPAAAVLIWNNQLDDVPAFNRYLPTRYVHARTVGDDREAWLRFDPERIGTRQAAVFYDVARLEGFTLDEAVAQDGADGGTVVPLELFWRAIRPTPAPLTVFVHLVAPDGTTVAQADGPPPVDTDAWMPDQIVPDRRALTVPADVPAGRYQVRVGFYDRRTLERTGAARPDGTLWPEGAVVLESEIDISANSASPGGGAGEG